MPTPQPIPEAFHEMLARPVLMSLATTLADGLQLEAERFKLSDAVVVLQDGTVLIAGGNRQVQRFDPNGNEFERVGTLETAYYYQTATLLQDGRVLIVGGYDDRIQPVQKAWIINS